MNLDRILIMLVCAGVGYWVVSALMGRSQKPPATPGSAPHEPPGGAGAGPRDPPAAPSAQAGVTLTNWYQILGVAETASMEEVVAAYKRRISEYHPDKVAQMGAEIRALAEQKSQQINAAYELGMRRFR